jgi:hypothetical protein
VWKLLLGLLRKKPKMSSSSKEDEKNAPEKMKIRWMNENSPMLLPQSMLDDALKLKMNEKCGEKSFRFRFRIFFPCCTTLIMHVEYFQLHAYTLSL